MTLTAMTAPLSVREEIRISCQQLLASDGIVAEVLLLAVTTIIIVSVWTTVCLMPEGIPPSYLAFWPTYDYSNGLEYCSSLSRHAITWPLSFHGCGCC
jgi:hypothetical protein